MTKNTYMTVAVPGTKKVSVCSRRIGTRDRLNVIATANNEEVAEKIVDALNALQGQIDKLDAPAKRELEVVRAAVQREVERTSAAERARREAENKVRDLQARLNGMTQERDIAIRARDAAQKTARETA